MKVLICLERRVAGKRQQFVCGDTNRRSGVRKLACPASSSMRSAEISATLAKIDQPLLSLGYCDSLSLSDCPHRMRGETVKFSDVFNLGVRVS